jgi:6-phospho-beta-glucosidase
MATLCQHIVDLSGHRIDVIAAPTVEECIRESNFVISSIRVGGMEGRARDERLALDCGFAGQETTGPAGFAMAMRTIPVALEHARIVERLAPDAWLLNFTNPAGTVTQAISSHTGVKTVGICDTPSELIHKIGWALGEPAGNVECDYVGLNHLGWVTAIRVNHAEVGDRARDPKFLRSLYSASFRS